MASWEAIYWGLPDALPRKSRERLATLARGLYPRTLPGVFCAAKILADPQAHSCAIELLREMHAFGMEVTVKHTGPNSGYDGGEIKFRDPRRQMTAELRERLNHLRTDMITLIWFGPVRELTWAEFARSGRVLRVALPSAECLLAADNADPCHPLLIGADGRMIYRARQVSNGQPKGRE